jgi:hypothetical protein
VHDVMKAMGIEPEFFFSNKKEIEQSKHFTHPKNIFFLSPYRHIIRESMSTRISAKHADADAKT